MKTPTTSAGMTLIEILLTVMIMATAAAITLPSVMDMRRTGSEARAAMALKGELLPACLQYQQMYDETRDMDDDQLGDFPLHPACLCGGRAGLNAELATAQVALSSDLVDRNIWGTASAIIGTPSYNGGSAASYYSSQKVNLRLPSGASYSAAFQGVNHGGYSFGFLTGGTPHIYYTDSYPPGVHYADSSLRDVMITLFATPNQAESGHRSFAMSINPFLYRGMVAQTNAPESYFPYHTWYLSYSASVSGSGMFFYPAGIPVAEAASAATGGVSIPGIFRLNTTVTSQMR